MAIQIRGGQVISRRETPSEFTRRRTQIETRRSRKSRGLPPQEPKLVKRTAEIRGGTGSDFVLVETTGGEEKVLKRFSSRSSAPRKTREIINGRQVQKEPEQKITTAEIIQILKEEKSISGAVRLGKMTSGGVIPISIKTQPKVSKFDEGLSVKKQFERQDLERALRLKKSKFVAESEKKDINKLANKLFKARKKQEIEFLRALDKKSNISSKLEKFNTGANKLIDKVFNIELKLNELQIKAVQKDINKLSSKKSLTPFEKRLLKGSEKLNQKLLEENRRLKNPSFSKEVTKGVVKNLNRILNPFMVVVNLSGLALASGTLSKTTKGKAFIKKAISKGVKSIATGKAIESLAKISKKGLKQLSKIKKSDIEKLVKKAKEFSKTPEGLASLITLAVLLRVDKIAIKGIKGARAVTRQIKNNSNVRRVLSRSIRSPLTILTGVGGRGGKITKKTAKKILKRAGVQIAKRQKRISKAEIRKRVSAFKTGNLTFKQRKDLKLLRAKSKFKPKELAGFKITKSGELKLIVKKNIPKGVLPRKTRTERVVERALRKQARKIKIAKKEGFFIDKQITKKSLIKSVEKAIKRNTKEVPIGKNLLVLKTSKKQYQQATKQLIKKAIKKESKQKLVRIKFSKTTDKVTKDLHPETLFPNLILPSTSTTTRGFRPGMKQKLFKAIAEKQKALKFTRQKEVNGYLKFVQTFIKREVKIDKNKVKILNKLLSPKIKKSELIRLLPSKTTVSKFNTKLKAISLLNFKIASLNKIKSDIKEIQISKAKSKQKQAQKPKSVVKKKLITKPKLKKPKQKVATKLKKIIKTKIVTPQVKITKIIKSKITSTKTKIKKPKVTSISKKVKKPKIRSLPFRKKGKLQLKRGERLAYNIRIKRAGKIMILNVKLPINKAKRKLINILDHSIARSGEIFAISKTKQKDISKVSFKGFALKRTKNSLVLRIVENISKALDTPREKRQIARARKLKSKKKLTKTVRKQKKVSKKKKATKKKKTKKKKKGVKK